MHQSQNRVLVVDRDADMAMVICDFLNGTGRFRVDCVEDAGAALKAWERQPYDLLIADYVMRGMNGAELISALRQLKGRVPAIMMSGNPNDTEALESGAAAFLAKPFPMSRLLDEATRILRLTPGTAS